MQANQPTAPYCRPVAVQGKSKRPRLGGSRCAGALAFMTWGVATTDEKGEAEE